VEELVNFLKQRTPSKKAAEQEPPDFPVGDPGPWPKGSNLRRREDMYGDDGR